MKESRVAAEGLLADETRRGRGVWEGVRAGGGWIGVAGGRGG
jgi:hypothetical protein